MPEIRYQFETPRGPIDAASFLSRPFKVSFNKFHPILRLSDYFKLIKEIFLSEKDKGLYELLEIKSPLKRLTIRKEKHGSFYQVSRVIIEDGNAHLKEFAVLTALGKTSRGILLNDFNALFFIYKNRKKKVIPKPFWHGQRKIKVGNKSVIIGVAILKWLTGYHEWHFTRKGADKRLFLTVWSGKNKRDFSTNDRFTKLLYFSMARILAYCFCPQDLRQVNLFSNAAGDFIVKIDQGNIDVKLTTIRSYKRVTDSKGLSPDEEMVSALLFLFLDIMWLLRLDRINGTGDYVFAPKEVIDPAIPGFFMGLKDLKKEGRIEENIINEFKALLSCLKTEEVYALYLPVFEKYEKDGRNDVLYMKDRFYPHVNDILIQLKSIP